MIKIISLGLDKKIFEPNSASLERLKVYSSFCDKMVVVVLTLHKFAPIKTSKLEVYATGSGLRFKYFFDAKRLIRKILEKEKMDVIMSQDPFETGFLCWLAKRKYHLPWQCQIHGDIFSPYFRRESVINRLRFWLARFLIPRADGFRVVSERIKKSLLDNFKNLKSPITVLPIFVDAKWFESAEVKTDLRQKYSQFNFLILSASRLSKEKNISLQIKALAEVVEKYPKVGLLVVGEGKQKGKLESLVKNYSLESKVIFEPWSQDLASYYKTADLFLLTSNYEGWGMTVVEAASCGCPIVMTDVGCAGEFIKADSGGLVIPVGDKESLVKALERMISDKELRKKLSEEAKVRALSLSDRQEHLDAYKKSFEDLI